MGAHAVIFYSQPRFTRDLDIWIPAALNDPGCVYEALKSFGAPLRGITPENFQDPRMILQIGIATVRIDVFIDLPPVSAKGAWDNRQRSRYGKTPINIIGLEELIKLKKTANRLQDKLDLQRLKKTF